MPDADVQGLRELTRLRAELGAQSSDIKRRVITVLDRGFPAFAPGCRDVCGLPARAILEAWALPEEIAAIPTTPLAGLLARVAHGRCGADTAPAVPEAAQRSIGGRRAADALAFERRLLWRQVGYLAHQVTDREQAIGRRYKALDVYLRTIPGVGSATAPAINAEIGDIRRFTDSDQLVALVGVAPQLHQAGQQAGQTKRRKRGSPYRRRAIGHAALTASRLDPMFQAI